MLTKVHKSACVFHCCDFVNHAMHVFHHFYDFVHIDEKWFFVSERKMHIYLSLGENRLHCTTQNKQDILKVMFLCAIARPRYDANGNRTFDGKLGIWPFVETAPAQRSSRNCP